MWSASGLTRTMHYTVSRNLSNSHPAPLQQAGETRTEGSYTKCQRLCESNLLILQLALLMCCDRNPHWLREVTQTQSLTRLCRRRRKHCWRSSSWCCRHFSMNRLICRWWLFTLCRFTVTHCTSQKVIHTLYCNCLTSIYVKGPV
jgi:hypothetical protein